MNQSEARWIALAAWYRGAGRDLPWRGSPDPWVILVSEVMLQQTQVVRVTDRLGPFLAEFPDPTSLALASRQQVLAAWSGLGYNRRATRLQDAAALIDREGWPTTMSDLRTLPGVGRYTAAAVACLAFGEQVAAVDINVRRVLSRWVGRVLSPSEAAVIADEFLPADEAHHWIQAVMDLGATTCTSREPACQRCPCEPWCTGAAIEVTSRAQSAFRGSVREARGRIVRELATDGQVDLDALADAADTTLFEGAAQDLQREGLVAIERGIVTLRETLDTHEHVE